MNDYERLYIDGEWVAPISSTRRFELINPATEQPFASIALGDSADVDRAVAAARRAFAGFSATSKADRISLLERIIAGFERRQGDIMSALIEEMGAPASLTAQTGAALAALRQAIATLKDYTFEVRDGVNLLVREPIGVAGLITPWNWPIQLLCNKLSSALSAGCPVVVKPSEFTSVSALIFTEVVHEAGTPKGVFNLVTGDGPGVGAAISAHEDIDIVSFTGSTRAGALVAAAAAPSVKRIAQELGGKSANILLPDADLRVGAEYNVSRGFSNSGQSCHSPTRLLVHETQLDEVIGYLKASVESTIRVGDPSDPATTHGPVVNRAQFETVQRYIEIGLKEGGRLICGGPGRPPGLERGYFVRPTIFAGITRDMTIAREEIFGMVTVVMSYKTIDEAIEIANDTPYGLGGYVFGGDCKAALEVCRRVRAGRIFYNGAPANTSAPMGGYKKSGNGREMGVSGLEEYLELKAIIGFD